MVRSVTAPKWLAESPSELSQGDLIKDYSLPIPERNGDGWGLVLTSLDLVVLTQSCDIDKPVQTHLLVATALPYSSLVPQYPQLGDREYRLNLVRGQSIADFLLPPLPGVQDDWTLVNFRRLFSIPKDEARASHRLELVSPYREALAQAFGRFMMRVGLPAGIQNCEPILPRKT